MDSVKDIHVFVKEDSVVLIVEWKNAQEVLEVTLVTKEENVTKLPGSVNVMMVSSEMIVVLQVNLMKWIRLRVHGIQLKLNLNAFLVIMEINVILDDARMIALAMEIV